VKITNVVKAWSVIDIGYFHKWLVVVEKTVSKQWRQWRQYNSMEILLFCYGAAGGRDKRGGPILQFPSESGEDDLSASDISTCLTYLACLPRYVVWLGALT